MIISFFGHSSFYDNKITVCNVVDILEKKINNKDVEFYLGNYGSFDTFAYNVAKEYQSRNTNAKLVFITPYLNNERCNEFSKKCDSSVYPEIEKIPLKYAIIERNKWVVRKSDLIIFYYKFLGGTAIAYDYAIKKRKTIINLARRTF